MKLAIMLLILGTSFGAMAAKVEVYCLSSQCPSIVNDGKRLRGIELVVHELDATDTISEHWSEQLKRHAPKNEEEGEAFISALMNSQRGREDMAKMKASLLALEDVVLKGIAKIPAYLCDDRHVVYGGTLNEAVTSCRSVWRQ
ncbi:DUF1525 domain-containing protein [Vibrio vulnificus]